MTHTSYVKPVMRVVRMTLPHMLSSSETLNDASDKSDFVIGAREDIGDAFEEEMESED